ncbi:Uncharacterised protein [Vibrio cholerae]|nr:Uncharacterised protein [Vibrio cholerae]
MIKVQTYRGRVICRLTNWRSIYPHTDRLESTIIGRRIEVFTPKRH